MAEDGSIVLKIKTEVDSSVSKNIADIKKKYDELQGSVSAVNKESVKASPKISEVKVGKDSTTGVANTDGRGAGVDYSKDISSLENKIQELIQSINSLTQSFSQYANSSNASQQAAQQTVAGGGGGGGDVSSAKSIGKSFGSLPEPLTSLEGVLDGISKGFTSVGKSIAKAAKRILVYQTLYKVINKLAEVFKAILMSDEEFKKDWKELEAAVYAVAQPLIQTLIPVAKQLLKIVKDIMVSIGKVIAMLQGITYSDLLKQAQASKEMADNYNNAENSAENMATSLAGFDDIEILSSSGDSGEDNSAFGSLAEEDVTAGAADGLTALATTLSTLLVALGWVLITKFGVFSWGLGFIVAGAYVYGVKEIWGEKYSDNEVVDLTTKIMKTIGGALCAIGIILLLFGVFTWGLAFLAAGALVFVESEIVANWDGLGEDTQNAINLIWAIVSVALLVLGCILAFTQVALPLGIGLIVVGAASLAPEVAINWDSICESVTNAFNAVKDWIETYGMLVLGIILCITVVGLPIGIALIIKWAKDNEEEVDLAKSISSKVSEVWDAVKGFWNKHIAKFFEWKFWQNLAADCGNGIIEGFESAVNGIIWLFETAINWVVDGLNSLSFDIPDWLGGGKFGFNLPKAEFSRVKFGRIEKLANGAVIPPNKEFLAVLGDQKSGVNIETPLQTMIDAFNIALNSRESSTSHGSAKIVLEVDGREFGRAVVELGKLENRRIGTSLVVSK